MSLAVRTLDYFYIRVEDQAGRAYQLLEKLASEEINLLAFSAVPFGNGRCELTIFPDSTARFRDVAQRLGWTISNPQHAFLIQGDDRLGALADIHHQLLEANVNIYASTGVTDGQGHYGYIIYVKDEDFPIAAKALRAVQLP